MRNRTTNFVQSKMF